MKPVRLAAFSLTLLLASAVGPAYGLEFPRTSDRGAPSRSVGGASRGEVCLDLTEQPTLTALLPNNALATTYAADSDIPASLFFYIPAAVTRQAELAIVDATGEAVHTQMVTLPETAGILQVMLPQTDAAGEPLFAAGEVYYWDFALRCDPEDPENIVLVSGGIQRAEADAALQAELAAAEDSLAKAEIYAAAGAWQETLALAAQLRPENPDPWRELLTSVGLEAVADAPVVSTEGACRQ